MKTLHVLFLISVTISLVIIGEYSMLSQTSHQSAGIENLQLSTPKSNYVDGEIIPISGYTLQNLVINIFLVDNHGNIENSTQANGNNTGYFNTNLGIPLHVKGGAWSLFAKSGESNFATQIMVNSHDENPQPFNAPSGFSPLKQFKLGIESRYVQCKTGLQLLIKSEDGFPACIKPNTAQILIERGWAIMPNLSQTNNIAENACGKFFTGPESQNYSNTVPVLLLKSNSTACAKLTFTIISDYKDCNGQSCPHVLELGSTLPIGNLHYEKHGSMISISSGKNYANSFKITTIPEMIDLANYPVGANFTVNYIIKPLPNATGFYDQSIPRLACERYPLVVGHTADQVNASDFSYIDPLNPPCAAGAYVLTGVEISGMDYKEVTLRLSILG